MGEVDKRANGLETRVVDRLAELIGREVVVEGTFPIPVGQQYAFSPMTSSRQFFKELAVANSK